MKKDRIGRVIIYFSIFLLIVIIILIMMIKNLENQNNTISTNEIDDSSIKEPSTVQEVLEKYNSKFIRQEYNDIYVDFDKDLYDEYGKSNENYFNSIIEELKPFFKYTFSLIDEEKNIVINIDIQDNKITINNNENFYKETDGKTYVEVENVKIADKTYMHINSEELSDVAYNGMFVNSMVEEGLGEPDELQISEEYTSYKDSSILVSKYNYTNRVRNMVFSREYQSEIMSGINQNDSLQEIQEKKPNVAFGSVRDGYLGYRTDYVYIFYYKDEVSVYGYSYVENKEMEDYIEEYLETQDLSKFYTKMVIDYDNFYQCEYDETNNDLYLSYPSLGIEINIKNNIIEEITLYNNYYFTDRSKQWVKDGIITLEGDTDFLHKIEKERVSR